MILKKHLQFCYTSTLKENKTCMRKFQTYFDPASRLLEWYMLQRSNSPLRITCYFTWKRFFQKCYRIPMYIGEALLLQDYVLET